MQSVASVFQMLWLAGYRGLTWPTTCVYVCGTRTCLSFFFCHLILNTGDHIYLLMCVQNVRLWAMASSANGFIQFDSFVLCVHQNRGFLCSFLQMFSPHIHPATFTAARPGVRDWAQVRWTNRCCWLQSLIRLNMWIPSSLSVYFCTMIFLIFG